MVLVAALTTFNVLLAENPEGGPSLENSIAIGLTAVLVLPELAEGKEDLSNTHVLRTGSIYALFIGIILASFCKAIGDEGDVGAEFFNFADEEFSGGGPFEAYKMVSSVTKGAQPWSWIRILNYLGIVFLWISISIPFYAWWKHNHLKANMNAEVRWNFVNFVDTFWIEKTKNWDSIQLKIKRPVIVCSVIYSRMGI
jgi:hypothetical protein